MKRFITLLAALLMLSGLVSCGKNGNAETDVKTDTTAGASPESTATTSQQSQESEPDSSDSGTAAKSLVVYFSWSGNTEKVAKSIQSQTGSDIFEIVPETPYSDDYDTEVDQAKDEQRKDARPAIRDSITNMDSYDTVYVGFPNWWGDMPMILYTFFDNYDLSGKNIALFCTSGGSGLSDTVNEVKNLEPNANVTDGLHIGSSAASDPDEAVKSWLDDIGLA